MSLMHTELWVSNFGMCLWRTGSPRLNIRIWSRSNRSFFAEFHQSSFAAGQRVGSGLFHLDMCTVHGQWKRQRHLLSDGSEMFRAWRGWPSTFWPADLAQLSKFWMNQDSNKLLGHLYCSGLFVATHQT